MYTWQCSKCKKVYQTPQPIPVKHNHICPQCYYQWSEHPTNQDMERVNIPAGRQRLND